MRVAASYYLFSEARVSDANPSELIGTFITDTQITFQAHISTILSPAL